MCGPTGADLRPYRPALGIVVELGVVQVDDSEVPPCVEGGEEEGRGGEGGKQRKGRTAREVVVWKEREEKAGRLGIILGCRDESLGDP